MKKFVKLVGRAVGMAALLFALSVFYIIGMKDAFNDIVIDKSLLTWVLYGDIL